MKGTLAQKILARASGKADVKPGEYVIADINMVLVNDLGMHAVSGMLREAGIKRLWDPDKVVCVIDHLVPAPTIQVAEMYKEVREAVARFGVKNFYSEGGGICHQVMVEKGYVVPGDLTVATDSHTTTYGALAAAGTGIGFSEMAYVMATGKLWFKVPETIKFVMSGTLQRRVMSKDVMLHIAGKYTSSVAQYKAVEFSGPMAQALSIPSRMTMSNMTVEIGAKFGFFDADETTEAYLSQRARRSFGKLKADDGAVYEKVFDVDVTKLEPQVALPYAVDNVKPVSSVGEIRIDQAVLGSCTNGRLEDLRVAAEIMKGKKVHPDTRCLVIPASAEVYRDAMAEGIMATLLESGAVLCNPGCGPCFGGCMGLLASGETAVASINRNFRGRMGSPESKVYLASPALVAASAIAGKLTDPRNF